MAASAKITYMNLTPSKEIQELVTNARATSIRLQNTKSPSDDPPKSSGGAKRKEKGKRRAVTKESSEEDTDEGNNSKQAADPETIAAEQQKLARHIGTRVTDSDGNLIGHYLDNENLVFFKTAVSTFTYPIPACLIMTTCLEV